MCNILDTLGTINYNKPYPNSSSPMKVTKKITIKNQLLPYSYVQLFTIRTVDTMDIYTIYSNGDKKI